MRGILVLMLLGLAQAVGAAVEDDAAAAILARTNDFRREQGLDAVDENGRLREAAREFARYMAKTGKFGHTADGRQPAARAAARGYEYCMVAENLGTVYSRPAMGAAALAKTLVEGWKDSPEHRKNLEQPIATEIGIGLASDAEGRWYAVQLFGRPMSAAVRFEVENRAGQAINYRAGDERFSLSARARRTHRVCGPTELAIEAPSRGDFMRPAADGVRYTVREDGVTTQPAPGR